MVSVIIPVFNAEEFLAESLNSIINQTYKDLEIIICDDKSTDRSLETLKKNSDSRIRIIKNEINIGYLRTINKLLDQANGGFIAFHDADDVSHPDRILSQVTFLNANSDISLVGTNFNVIDSKGKVIHHKSVQHTDPIFIKQNLISGNLFQKPSVLFRREILREVGGFREEFLKLGNISEDYDWLLRISERFLLSNVNGDMPLYSYRSVVTAMSKKYESIDQHIGHKLAQFLANERRQFGTDSIINNDYTSLIIEKEKMRLPYINDRSLFYFEKAESHKYYGLTHQALVFSFKAIMIDPYKWRNIRCMLSVVKSIIHRVLK
jgi:glycosyltransferase involved in cell wall biosynthesis